MSSVYGPDTVTSTGVAPRADIMQSTVPSPPSAIGIVIISASGKNMGIVRFAILQISALLKVPLNESETTITLSMKIYGFSQKIRK